MNLKFKRTFVAKSCVGGERVSVLVVMVVKCIFHSHVSLSMEMILR